LLSRFENGGGLAKSSQGDFMEKTYLHFNITNMITIWIIVGVGFGLLGLAGKAWQNKAGS
jgi:hypothetical protein